MRMVTRKVLAKEGERQSPETQKYPVYKYLAYEKVCVPLAGSWRANSNQPTLCTEFSILLLKSYILLWKPHQPHKLFLSIRLIQTMEKSNHNPAAAVCMRQAKSCGFLIMKSDLSFLLMKHPKRYDLPKGHVDSGESEQQTALRELREESGILADDIIIDPLFRFEEKYFAKYKRFGGETVEKTLVIFLATLKNDSQKLKLTEHGGFEWKKWTSPPAPIQKNTIDPLLAAVHAHLQKLKPQT